MNWGSRMNALHSLILHAYRVLDGHSLTREEALNLAYDKRYTGILGKFRKSIVEHARRLKGTAEPPKTVPFANNL